MILNILLRLFGYRMIGGAGKTRTPFYFDDGEGLDIHIGKYHVSDADRVYENLWSRGLASPRNTLESLAKRHGVYYLNGGLYGGLRSGPLGIIDVVRFARAVIAIQNEAANELGFAWHEATTGQTNSWESFINRLGHEERD